MNFYTLDYDCNTPVTQQINVPTNTDYKVGIKVTRNGKLVTLNSAEVALDGLSSDREKTNGYMTFTNSTSDTPSFVQKNLDIHHGYEIDVVKKSYFFNTTGANYRYPYGSELSATVEELGLVGQTIKATDIWFAVSPSLSVNVEPTVDEMKQNSYFTASEPTKSGWNQQNFIHTSNGDAWLAGSAFWSLYEREWKEAGLWSEEDGPVFMFTPTGSDTPIPLKELTFSEGDSFYCTSTPQTLAIATNKGRAYCWGIRKGEPFNAKFKLVENIYKSQKGDINLIGRANTVNFAGTDGQGKAFSYDVIVK